MAWNLAFRQLNGSDLTNPTEVMPAGEASCDSRLGRSKLRSLTVLLRSAVRHTDAKIS